ncbi:DNA polymerase IV [Zwartia panacis]|uniref:DNA polymerase IV n=1 Tax=Zwartia panacis TaxID=2683345 RepID=UPI0025B4B6D5|nr:DNA polymerase IV [Zwartia panacis]MDN4018191.1 DNA polymerase IV [Zwartia panacis]
MTRRRRIAHLDMDAFFASVELLSFPELKGKPVVVGGRSTEPPKMDESGVRHYARLRDYVGRGVITTSTYEARALGVFSGMGLMKSAALAPDAILLPANFEAYRHYSRLFKTAVATIAPQIEDRGIDEIYIDLTDLDQDTDRLALRIKQAVRDATGLSCSIGISPNKLLSKICSDLDKPDGVTILDHAELSTRIWPLPAKKINGIGPKANEKLAGLGIHTIGDLASAEPQMLIAHFGRATGHWLHQAAHGIDERPVVTSSEPKSLSRETTFERDLHVSQDRARLSSVFTELCNRLSEDLLRKGYATKTIGIKVKYADFQVLTRDLTLTAPVYEGGAIRRAATECLRRIPLDQKIRLLGVRAGSLMPIASIAQDTQSYQPDLPF